MNEAQTRFNKIDPKLREQPIKLLEFLNKNSSPKLGVSGPR